jgi:hypothetical protein
MQQDFEPRRRRWPSILIVLVVLLAALWSGGWYFAAGKVEETIAGWKEREARSGRVYNCASQTVSGFPFSIQVRCANASAELTTTKPPMNLKAQDMLVTAEVFAPTVLTSTIIGPLTITEPGASTSFVASWRNAQAKVHGLPTSPERVETVLDDLVLDRVNGAEKERLFNAKRMVLEGRMVAGSARNNPVIEVVLKLAQGSAPTLHPATAAPLDADITAMLRGLKNFAPKPWPVRFKELQAAGGRIEVMQARVQQGDTIATANGAFGLSQNAKLDGQLQLTIANLEKLIPTLGLDKMMAPQAPQNKVGSAIGALDRLSPGLGNIARQNAGPALVAGLSFIGRPTDLEGKRAVTVPLRLSDGAVSLGPIPLGQTPPLY